MDRQVSGADAGADEELNALPVPQRLARSRAWRLHRSWLSGGGPGGEGATMSCRQEEHGSAGRDAPGGDRPPQPAGTPTFILNGGTRTFTIGHRSSRC
jgi:hypothetical protein